MNFKSVQYLFFFMMIVVAVSSCRNTRERQANKWWIVSAINPRYPRCILVPDQLPIMSPKNVKSLYADARKVDFSEGFHIYYTDIQRRG